MSFSPCIVKCELYIYVQYVSFSVYFVVALPYFTNFVYSLLSLYTKLQNSRYTIQRGFEKNEPLKVPKREIFDRSDFPDFYTIKSSWVGDLLVKILTYYFNF